MVDNRLEHVSRFDHAIRTTVFGDDLIELIRGRQEEYGGDAVEALEPFLTLRSLTANINETAGRITDSMFMLMSTHLNGT